MSEAGQVVYVVLGENGEYSDRSVFVSGVFSDRETAERHVLESSARYRERDIWDTRRQSALDESKRTRLAASYRELLPEATKIAGPEPEYEAAERAEIFEVPVGVWNSHGYNGS